MRIYQLCADRGISPDGTKGASVHLRAIARALLEQGHDVHSFIARTARDASCFPAPLHAFGSAEDVVRQTRKTGPPDLLYERYALGCEAGLEAARALGCVFALEVNAPLVYEALHHRPGTLLDGHDRIERRLWREADAVFAVSEPLRQYVARRRGTDAGTFAVPNGCDPSLYPDPPDAAEDGRQTLVFLGHPKPWHGADRLAPLLAALTRRRRDVDLLLIGGGAGAEEVLRSARALGVSENVRVSGAVPQATAAAFLRLGTVALAPYPSQEFFYFCPLKVVEYMAAGLPVVASALGDIPRILDGAGVLVPPGDFGHLVDAVDSLLDDPPRRARLGAEARARAVSQLTWSEAAATIALAVEEHLGVSA